MSICLWDRIHQRKTCNQPRGELLISQLRITLENSNVLQNGKLAAAHDFLVPDQSGRWRLMETGESSSWSGSFGKAQIASLGDRKSLIEWAKGYDQWPLPMEFFLSQSLLEDRPEEKTKLHLLESKIRENLGYLRAVFQKPRAHLKVEIEKVFVGRARRIPTNAISYLASHTEDWEGRNLFSITPKKVLTLLPEDQLDIYENRLAARLIDRLLVYLRGRIREVERLEKMFQVALDYSSKIVHATHFRRARICEVWGSSQDAGSGLTRAKATLFELKFLFHELSGLKDTALYRAIPRNTKISGTRKTTNILTNDPNYRRIAILWDCSTTFSEKEDSATFQSEMQKYCNSFDLFCFSLIFCALRQLRFTPDSSANVEIGSPVTFIQNDRIALLRSCEDGTILLEEDDRKLRFIPIIGQSALESDDIDFNARLNLENPTAMLCLSQDSNENSSLKILPDDWASGQKIMQQFVAPWEIESAERVGGILRWFFSGFGLVSFPYRKAISPTFETLLKSFSQSSEIEISNNETSVLKPIYEADIYKAVILKIDSIEAAIAKEESDLSMISSRNKQERKIHMQKKREFEEEKRGWITIREICETGDKLISRLLQCPVCRKTCDRYALGKSSADGYLLIKCLDCFSQWGNRICPACQKKVPFLQPSGHIEVPEELEQVNFQKIVGADMLALPISIVNDRWSFQCPSCGNNT